MQPASSTQFVRARRALSASIPVSVAGSLTLMLSATPAQAAEPVRHGDHRMPRSFAHDDATLRVPASATSAATHTVTTGDTVSTIAAQYGLNTGDVLALNGLSWSSSTIYPGQVLLLSTAPIEAAPATPVATASATYVIVAGDTMSAIAGRYDVSTDALLAANGLDRASIIYPGQSIAIPSADSMVLVAATTPMADTAPAAAPASAAAPSDLDAEQIANAHVIIAVGRELGVPDRGIAIALGTAMQESWLRNLDWGDRDSLGLFQQRPSTGWGTEAEVRDIVRATKVFFGGASDPNGYLTRGLLDIPDWQSLSFADAAQAVQISAYPDRYAQWEQPAYSWLSALG